MDDFEQYLSKQPLRPVPETWREEILAASRPSSGKPPVPIERWLSALVTRLSTWLWPNPQAWAGLAAVWIAILALDFSARDKTPARAEPSTPPSPQVIAQWRQQQRLLAELMGPAEPHKLDRPKRRDPPSRSERAIEMMVT